MLIDVDFRTEEHRLQFMNLQQSFFNYSSLKTFIDHLFYSIMIVLYQQTKYIDDFNNKRCDKQQDQLIIVLVETQLNNLQEQRDGVKNDLWDYYKLFLYPEYCDDITKENRNDITERFYISLFNEIINNQQFKDYLLYQSFLSRSTIAIEEYTYQDYKLQQQNTDSDMLAVLSSTIYNISKIFLKCIKQQSPIPGSNKNQEQQLNEILNII